MRHADGNGAIELHNRGRPEAAEFGIEIRDARPIGLFRCVRARMAGCQGRFELVSAARSFERDALLGQCPLRSHDTLRHGNFLHQEGALDLFRGQAAKQAKGQGDARFGG
ncbi:MAG TPA: hypothetical protein VKV17_06830 [Bryobacteraceae bacterium]|nr:hypothetical protein [Bryobacteraceae bacterium]